MRTLYTVILGVVMIVWLGIAAGWHPAINSGLSALWGAAMIQVEKRGWI